MVNMQKLVLKTAAVNSEFLRITQKAVFFHSTSVLYKREQSASDQLRHQNFVKGFSKKKPFWEGVVVRIPIAPPDDGPVQDYYCYNPYTKEGYYESKKSRDFTASHHFNKNWKSQNWNNQNEQKHDFSKQSDTSKESKQEMASERLELGLSASGPLSLDDIKNAYRTCALKWHPDHNQGLYKAVAEEKFKSCNAAYKSLCDMLAAKE